MTGAEDTKRTATRSPAGLLARPLRPYAEIFRIPGAWRFSTAAIIGRMPMSMFGLGTVLLISAATGRYGVAGAVSAAGSLGYAFSAPRIARLTDSRGQREVLLPLLTVFALATVALIVAVQSHLPIWAVFVPGAIAGAAMPSLGTMVRARWSVLLAGSPRLHAALLEAQAKRGRRTEAMSWLSSGISVGVAAGASVVGFIIDAHGPRLGYTFAAACGVASAVTCLAGLRRLRTSDRTAAVKA